MRIPVIPYDEAQRIAELNQLDILDSPQVLRFDRYTRLARRLFNVPIALVSMVDTNRQWFKSCIGLDVKETPRDISFCGHAILDSEIFVVTDASSDKRFMHNPLVTGEPHIRFYAGFPLTGLGGHRLGTLCIIDREPRDFAVDDLMALRDIGELVNSELASLELAGTDELTGLSNRRGFEMLAQQAVAVSVRVGETASVVVFDLDNLKHINDTFGHEVGDGALVEFARLLQLNFRESDVLARCGGDEFYALLTGTTQADSQAALQRLNESITQFNDERNLPYKLAYSAGIAQFPPGGRSDLALVSSEADARIYEQKRLKRSANAIIKPAAPGSS